MNKDFKTIKKMASIMFNTTKNEVKNQLNETIDSVKGSVNKVTSSISDQVKLVELEAESDIIREKLKDLAEIGIQNYPSNEFKEEIEKLIKKAKEENNLDNLCKLERSLTEIEKSLIFYMNSVERIMKLDSDGLLKYFG